MLSGVSGTIILTSVNYRYSTYFVLLYSILAILLNYILIPVYGITGAALAFLIANLLYSTVKFLYIFYNYGMNPYNGKFVVLILITAICIFICFQIPQMKNLILDIFIRSTLMILLFGSLTYFLNVSEDINSTLTHLIKSFFNK